MTQQLAEGIRFVRAEREGPDCLSAWMQKGACLLGPGRLWGTVAALDCEPDDPRKRGDSDPSGGSFAPNGCRPIGLVLKRLMPYGERPIGGVDTGPRKRS